MKTNEDKYKLIFGFNSNSPLFARIANDYLLNGEVENALPILEEGLKLFPNYPAAYFIYGICLAELGNITKSKEMIEKGGQYIDSFDTLNFYLDKIQNIAKLKNNNIPEISSIDTNDNFEKPEEIEQDDLAKLAKQLENAKINIEENSDSDFIAEEELEQLDGETGKPLVSETLARIYFDQGNYKEALALYQNLITIQPEREQFYQTKINQISKFLEP